MQLFIKYAYLRGDVPYKITKRKLPESEKPYEIESDKRKAVHW